MNSAPGFNAVRMKGLRSATPLAEIFATARSNSPAGAVGWGTEPFTSLTCLLMPVRLKFRRAAVTAWESISRAVTFPAPSFMAVMVNMPEPVPRSSTVMPGVMCCSMACMQVSVVGW